jgi:hypothetical protein
MKNATGAPDQTQPRNRQNFERDTLRRKKKKIGKRVKQVRSRRHKFPPVFMTRQPCRAAFLFAHLPSTEEKNGQKTNDWNRTTALRPNNKLPISPPLPLFRCVSKVFCVGFWYSRV